MKAQFLNLVALVVIMSSVSLVLGAIGPKWTLPGNEYMVRTILKC